MLMSLNDSDIFWRYVKIILSAGEVDIAVNVSPHFGIVTVLALGLLFCPVLALGECIPVLAPCQNGDPVLALGAPFKNWVSNPH